MNIIAQDQAIEDLTKIARQPLGTEPPQPVRLAAYVKRLNRRLVREGEQLRVLRGRGKYVTPARLDGPGGLLHHRASNERARRRSLDIVKLGLELGILGRNEHVVEEDGTRV